MTTKRKAEPTGECWCGCGSETKPGGFFLTGHDKTAESAVIGAEYGSVAQFILEHGYGPGGKNPRQVAGKAKASALAAWVGKRTARKP